MERGALKPTAQQFFPLADVVRFSSRFSRIRSFLSWLLLVFAHVLGQARAFNLSAAGGVVGKLGIVVKTAAVDAGEAL